MHSPTMKLILDDWIITALREMGKHNWLEYHPETRSDGKPRTSIKLVRPPLPDTKECRIVWRSIMMTTESKMATFFALYALSKSLAEGPKIFRPSVEQCEALENVDVNIKMEEYEQPFPAFLIEFPQKFREKLESEVPGEPCPRFSSLFHDKEKSYIFCSTHHTGERRNTQPGTTCIMSDKGWNTLEDALRFRVEHGKDLEIGERLYRISLNLALILVRYGAKNSGPLERGAYERNKKLIKSRNEKEALRAQQFQDASFSLIELSQDVKFHETITSHEPSDSVGPPKKPHWRRGHFRRQPYGEKHSLRKLIFIKPIFIKPHLFSGDLSDTEYKIHS